MKTLKYLFFILCLPLFAGCFEDETTVDTVRISEISIDTLKKSTTSTKTRNCLFLLKGWSAKANGNCPLRMNGR